MIIPFRPQPPTNCKICGQLLISDSGIPWQYSNRMRCISQEDHKYCYSYEEGWTEPSLLYEEFCTFDSCDYTFINAVTIDCITLCYIRDCGNKLFGNKLVFNNQIYSKKGSHFDFSKGIDHLKKVLAIL